MIQMFALDQAVEDVDLQRRVSQYLTRRGIAAAGKLDVDASAGVVTLRGKVGSKHWKWLAVECSRRVAGVVQLIDALEVGEPAALARLDSPRPRWPGLGRLDQVHERSQRHERQALPGAAHSRRCV